MTVGVVINDPAKFAATEGTRRELSLDATGALRTVASAGLPLGSTPAGHEFINDLSTSKSLTPPQAGTITALVIPNGAGIYYRLDGVAPTAAEGMPVPVGGFLKLESPSEIAGVRILQQAAGAKISVGYGK